MPDYNVEIASEWAIDPTYLTGIRVEADPYYGTRYIQGLSPNNPKIGYGEEIINVSPLPQTAQITRSDYHWTSSDPNIVTVLDSNADFPCGWLRAANPGKATLTATTNDGKHSDSIAVEVHYDGTTYGRLPKIVDAYGPLQTDKVIPGTWIDLNCGHHPSGKTFDHWECDDIEMRFANGHTARDVITQFIVPDKDVTVRAVWY